MGLPRFTPTFTDEHGNQFSEQEHQQIHWSTYPEQTYNAILLERRNLAAASAKAEADADPGPDVPEFVNQEPAALEGPDVPAEAPDAERLQNIFG